MNEMETLAEQYGIDPAQVRLGGNTNITPELRRVIAADAAAAGISNPMLKLSGAAPGQTYDWQPEAPAAAAVGARSPDLQMLMQRYLSAENPYAGELKVARETAAKETQAFQDTIQRLMEQKTEGPSKAELFFQLASAFGAPTRTGNFMESVGKASEVGANYSKAQREAAAADQARRQQLGITLQQGRMQAAKEDVATLRGLAAEEIRDRRAMGTQLFREFLASGKPQSEAGKAAADAGFKPGTPEYSQFVQKYIDKKMESGDWYKAIMASVAQQGVELRRSEADRKAEAAKKLTPQELKLKTETEDVIASSEQALKDLQAAFKLNPNTFDASLLDTAQRKILEAAGSEDPKVVNTRELENLLGSQALSKLKSTFPGAISNDERKALMELQGVGSKSKVERERIIKNAYKALNSAYKRQRQRLADINAGKYRETTPEAADAMPSELGEPGAQ